MLCEQAGPNLVDWTEGTLDAETAQHVRAHVDGCTVCRADLAAIHRWRGYAEQWHKVALPAGGSAALAARHASRWPASSWLDATPWAAAPRSARLLQWLPMAASAAALAIAVLLLFDQATAPPSTSPDWNAADARLLDARLDQWRQETWDRLDIDQSLLVAAVLEASRSQRQAELQALVRVIKGEIDRQSLIAEEGLRYVIGHQIEEQERLDALARHVNYAGGEPAHEPSAYRPEVRP